MLLILMLPLLLLWPCLWLLVTSYLVVVNKCLYEAPEGLRGGGVEWLGWCAQSFLCQTQLQC